MVPSTAVNEPPQVFPPSIEYSTVAPLSTPDTVNEPSRVIRSPALLPVSTGSETTGAAARVSSVKAIDVLADTFPAGSVWRTFTALVPSDGE